MFRTLIKRTIVCKQSKLEFNCNSNVIQLQFNCDSLDSSIKLHLGDSIQFETRVEFNYSSIIAVQLVFNIEFRVSHETYASSALVSRQPEVGTGLSGAQPFGGSI